MQHTGTGLGQRLDGAGVFECPARVHAGQVHACNRGSYGVRAGGDQELVKGHRLAVIEVHGFACRIDAGDFGLDLRDAQIVKVGGALAQVGALLFDVADQQIRNGHARIRRIGLVTHQGDGVGGGVFAQGFGGDDTGGACAQNDVVGHESDSRNR